MVTVQKELHHREIPAQDDPTIVGRAPERLNLWANLCDTGKTQKTYRHDAEKKQTADGIRPCLPPAVFRIRNPGCSRVLVVIVQKKLNHLEIPTKNEPCIAGGVPARLNPWTKRLYPNWKNTLRNW